MASPDDRHAPDLRIDWPIFMLSLACVLGAALAIVLFPEQSDRAVGDAFTWITRKLGVIYIVATASMLVFLFWLALGRYGRVRLSNEDAPPEFSTASWAAMLFCTGIGAGLIYWSMTEWVFYYLAPPFGLEPRSAAALQWATTYGLFHWGPGGWAAYCLPAVAMAYVYHVRGSPWLRLSSASEALLGEQAHGITGRILDLVVTVGLIGSAATGLGFATEIVAAAIAELAGTDNSYLLKLGVVLLTTATIGVSVWLGLQKGIRRLSNLNTVLAAAVLVFVLVAGPTGFIVETGVRSLGRLLWNYLPMSLWRDPSRDGGFVADWTVFYWGWWIALGPFVGIFVCKISRGRTIRELVFGVLGFGSLGCAMYFIVLGNYSLYLQLHGLLPVVDIVIERGQAAAISAIVTTLPMGQALLAVLMLVALIFAATTYDSASYTLASIVTRRLPAHEHPRPWHRVFWACVLGVMPAALLYLGGLKALQTISIIVSLPLIAVFVILAVALVRSLAADSKNVNL